LKGSDFVQDALRLENCHMTLLRSQMRCRQAQQTISFVSCELADLPGNQLGAECSIIIDNMMSTSVLPQPFFKKLETSSSASSRSNEERKSQSSLHV